MKQVVLLVFCMLVCRVGSAQFKRVAFSSGNTQVFASTSVAITHSGPAQTFLGHYCSYGPYQVGYWVNAFFIRFYSPFQYHFSFSNSVRVIRVDVGDLTNVDGISLVVNGIPYTLTNANLRPSSPTCQRDAAIISNGMLIGPPGYPPVFYLGHHGETAGLLQVSLPAGINAVTVAYNGILLPTGASGTYFSFSFGQVEAGNNGPVCEGGTVQLNGDSTITEPGSFYWTGPNGYSSTSQHPVLENLDPADTGDYIFRYITGADTLTDTTHVSLLPGPDRPVIAANANPICVGETLQLTATSSAGATFNWWGPARLNQNGATVTIPAVRSMHGGKYFVTAHEYTCSKTDSIDVTILKPVANTMSSTICVNGSYSFNGQVLTEAGIYIDTFTAANGCDSTIQLQLTIAPDPEVSIGTSVDVIAKPCLGDLIELVAAGASNYTWYHNGRLLSDAMPVQVTITELQNKFMLVGVDTNACTDTAGLDIEADGCCMVNFPTAFTPNGDGRNDRFGAIPATNTKVSNYRLEIFNRLGQQVYVGNNLAGKWDGTYKGMPAEMGVYYFVYGYECYGMDRIQKTGDVTLLR